MNLKRLSICCAAVPMAAVHWAAATAHHSTAAHYDESRTVEIRGELVEFELRSPHSSLTVDQLTADGTVRRWQIETRSLPQMTRRGWGEDSFRVGDIVTAYAWPNRSADKDLLFGTGFVTRDGTLVGELPDLENVEIDPDASGIGRLSGRWRGVPISHETAFSPLPLSPAGVEAWENYDPTLSPANTCAPVNTPSVYHAPNYLHEIRVTDDEVILFHEVYTVRRTVPLGDEPQQVEPSGLLGRARGRVEGDELVIETRDFPPSRWGLAMAALPNGNGADIPSSDEKRVTERLSVSEDGRTMTVEYVLEDPVYLTGPYSQRVRFYRIAADTPMFEYDCNVDSASRFSRPDD